MDDNTNKNEKIWDKLVQNDVLCSRPRLGLSPKEAYEYINQRGFYSKDLKGKNILCLAGGGGQQSIAFALLGANVTVVDFSEEQLKKDKLTADTYDKKIRIIKSDMSHLPLLKDKEFDIIYQPYSINYIPSIEKVFDEVQRILKPNGLYDLMFHNPYVHGTWKDGCWGSEWQEAELWENKGYPIWQPYKDSYPIKTIDPNWNFSNRKDEIIKIESPQEYRHTLATIMNGLIKRGFEILQFQEEVGNNNNSRPGTWEHYKSCAPPWLYLLGRKK